MSGLVQATDANFADVVAEGAVLVKFGAEWCGPCKMMAPVMAELASDLADAVAVVDVCIDNSPELVKKYGIRGIPTLMLFKDGQSKGLLVGARRKSEIEAFIEQSVD